VSEELEELNLEEIDVDPETGEVVVKRVEDDSPIDTPKEVKGSATLISNYMQCPAKAYGSMTRQPQEKGIALIQGIAIHTSLEKYTKYEEDPLKVFNRDLLYEAERNKLSLDGKEGDEARRIGTMCVTAGKVILDSKGNTGVEFRKRIDPNYVERGFVMVRNGRRYVGKLDGIAFPKTGGYVPYDWKSGKNAPKPMTFGAKIPKESALKQNVQFTLYAEGPRTDPTMPETFGKLPDRLVWMHLRGQSQERHESGRRKTVSQSEDGKVQYDFPTTRTQEEIDTHFTTVIDPIMGAMESGLYYRRDEGGMGCSWCGFWDKEKQQCKVELPVDAKERVKQAREVQQATEKKHEVIELTASLFGTNEQTMLTESRKAGLKTYN
jgi:hypothetical protein